MINHPPIDKTFYIRTNYKGGYEKLLVTIALRLGIEVKYPEDIELSFQGRWVEHNTAPKNRGSSPGNNDSYNYVGSIAVNGIAYTENEVKVCVKRDNPNNLLTLWPMFTDHRKNISDSTKTKPFIEEYLSGKLNLTISEIAKFYSVLFNKNPDRTVLDMSFEVSKIKDSLHEDEQERLKAEHAEETKLNEARSRKEKEEQEEEFKKNLDLVNIQNDERVKNEKEAQEKQEKEFKRLLKQQKQKETSKLKPDIEWTNSELTSAVFNYYEDSNQHLNIFINNKKNPIKLDKKLWKLQYSAALKSSKILQKGDIFEYITQGVNKLSPKECFNQLIINKYNDKREEVEESFDEDNTDNDSLGGVKYSLTHQTVSDLNNTKFTFNTKFNVIDTFLIPGDEFRKHYGFQWKNPMILIKTDVGWYIDAATNSKGETKWTLGEHHNCKTSLTKGKEHPYWLQK